MKKLFGLGVVLLLSLSACSGDDGPKDRTPAVSFDQLPKKWYYVSTKVGNQTTPYDGHTACAKDYIEFKAGTTVNNVDYTTCQDEPEIATGTYSVNTDSQRVTTVIDGETINYTIVKLNSRDLEAETTFNNLKITYIFASVP